MDYVRAATAAYQLVVSPLEQLDAILGRVLNSGSVIAEATSSGAANNITSNITSAAAKFVQSSAAAMPDAVALAPTLATGGEAVESVPGLLSMDYGWPIGLIYVVLEYATSRWAWSFITMSLLINRTAFYASSRADLIFRWRVRLAVYLAPIMALGYQALCLLRAIRCQTSPEWSQLRYNGAMQAPVVDMAGEGGLLYRLSAWTLLFEDDLTSCRAVNMGYSERGLLSLNGSLARLWPLYLSICLSHFAQAMSSALQRRDVVRVTGMLSFESSLAFSEMQTRLTKPFDVGSATAIIATVDGTNLKLTRGMLLPVLNAPPETLALAFVMCIGHLATNILDVCGLATRFRLVNTGIWGVGYMAVFSWALLRMMTAINSGADGLGAPPIPLVCVVFSLPPLLALLGLLACAAVYGVAILLATACDISATRNPHLSLKERLKAAHANMQANVYFSTAPLCISWSDDLFEILLKTAHTILTVASQTSFLAEGTPIRASDMTWLEKTRITQLTERRSLTQRIIDDIPAELRDTQVAPGVWATDASATTFTSCCGYARERTIRGHNGLVEARSAGKGNPFSLLLRRGRWIKTIRLFKSICRLGAALCARLVLFAITLLGSSRRPQWLMKLTGHDQSASRTKSPSLVPVASEQGGSIFFREPVTDELHGLPINARWACAGWWGDVDSSGDYTPPYDECESDDTLSIFSTSTTASQMECSEMLDDGFRTPTHEASRPSRQETPCPDDTLMDPATLARLLDPQTDDARSEAEMLATRLRSKRVITRSQHRKLAEARQCRILATRDRHGHPHHQDEESMLERFIAERRNASAQRACASSYTATKSNGPNCVVCHADSRSIILWPCACLSICNDCRIGLASRNFSSCICCRTPIQGYSKLFVP